MLKNLIKNINKKEWWFLGGITLLVIAATTAPYVYGYLQAPSNTHFFPVPALNKVDYPNYFSYIEQVRQGHVLFEDYYTTEHQPRIIFNLFFLVLGLIAKIFHLSAPAVFHLIRLVLIPVFIFVFYLFLKHLLKDEIKRKICMILVCFSSGLGAVFFPLLKNISPYQEPMDLWIPEAITFLSLYTNPLFISSLTLIILIFLLMLLSVTEGKNTYAVMAGLAGLILFQIHPYHVPTVFSILIIFWLAVCRHEKKINLLFLKHGLIFFFISLPSLLYYCWLSSAHWLTVHRIAQAIPVGFTPPLKSFFISYGLLWPLTLIGVYSLIKKEKDYFSIFLVAWLFTHIILIYLPFPLQRRLTEGLHLIVCLVASEGIFLIWQKIKEKKIFVFLKNGFLLCCLFLIFFTPSNIFVVAREMVFFHYPDFALPQETITAMTWLKDNSPQDTKVLSVTDLYLYNLIPAFSVRKVFVGHGCETAYYEEKIKMVDWFFNTNIYDEQKRNFLKENDLSHVFMFKKENYAFKADKKEYLSPVYENDLINIYQVK